MSYDFSGYATKHNILCSDGRTIMPNAFEECDGKTVPLVWQHVHDSPDNVVGHAELENRPDGVYAYCSLNGTPNGELTRELVRHGDICAMSIYANRLKEDCGKVMHGVIREVSLVFAGANPGATIDNLAVVHSDGTQEIMDGEAKIVFVGDDSILVHADQKDDQEEEPEEKKAEPEKASKQKTIAEVVETMNDEQKDAFYTALSLALGEEKESSDDSDDSDEMKHSDEPDSPTVDEVLNSLSDEQKKAFDEIRKAASDEGTEVSEEAKKAFESMTEDQKKVLIHLIGTDSSIKHSDEEDKKTIGSVMSTLNEEQNAALDEIIDAIKDGGKVSERSAELFNGLSEDQKTAFYQLVGQMLEDAEANSNADENQNKEVNHTDLEGESMKRNVFDTDLNEENVLTHSDMSVIFDDAKESGSLKAATLAHGITDIELLFPEAQAVNNEPYKIARRMEWVGVVLDGVHKSPFARIKSTAMNLTEEQARAKGYIKGFKKIEEQVEALKRVTTPQTIYKTQKLDRDDVVDITDFDVVAYMKQEMRMMLDEELARAILIGDGRRVSDPDKISEQHIRSVANDDNVYVVHRSMAVADANDYTKFMDTIIEARSEYKGSGNPLVMFVAPTYLTGMRLLKDNDNRYRYDSDEKLANAMRVSKVVEVEVFDEAVRTVSGKKHKIAAVILNLADYTVGANKGGEVNLFDDFDLDFNKYQYLIETRCSGALTVPYSAIVIDVTTVTNADPDPEYELVTSPDDNDIADYFERDVYGRYVSTNDEAVVTGKTYYAVKA